MICLYSFQTLIETQIDSVFIIGTCLVVGSSKNRQLNVFKLGKITFQQLFTWKEHEWCNLSVNKYEQLVHVSAGGESEAFVALTLHLNTPYQIVKGSKIQSHECILNPEICDENVSFGTLCFLV